jgi:hypothetical protein
VKPILLYGCESWTEGIRHKLQVFINRCLRTVLKIWWPYTISNEELWMKTGQVEIEHEIRKRKLGWMGHRLRKDDKEICTSKRTLYWNPIGKRQIGRPKETWKKSMLKETNLWQRWGILRETETNGENLFLLYVPAGNIGLNILGAPKFAEQLNGAMSTHVRK